MPLVLRAPTPDEVETLLRDHAAAMGGDPEALLEPWRRLPPERRHDEASRYLVAARDDAVLAGAYLHPGGFLTQLAGRDPKALRILLKALRVDPGRYGGPYRVDLAAVPPRERAGLVSVLGRAGYRRRDAFEMRCELIRLPELPPAEDALAWRDDLDPRFATAYRALTRRAWPWPVVKQLGGRFVPELWWLGPNGWAVVGLNEAPAAAARRFRAALLEGDPERLLVPLAAALTRAAELDELGVVDARADERHRETLERCGFAVVEVVPVYLP